MSLEFFVKKLFSNGIIMFGEFTLTSGIKSPYYIDLRKALSKPSLLREITFMYVSKIREHGVPDVIAGIETGSIAWAATVAYVLNKPMVYVRKKPKGHGAGRLIEGDISERSTVVVLDDVATTGGSLARAVEALRNEGANVSYALVFIDREQGAKERLEKAGVKLYSVFSISQLITMLHSLGYISQNLYEKLFNYIRGGKGV